MKVLGHHTGDTGVERGSKAGVVAVVPVTGLLGGPSEE